MDFNRSDEKAESDPLKGGAEIPVELRAVSGGGPAGSAVSGFSAMFQAGRLHLLRGTEDAGKAASFRLIGLLDKPVAGEVLVEKCATESLNEEARAELRTRRFGFVFNAPFLLSSFNVIENVAMPLFKISRVDPEEARHRSDSMLAFVGLEGLLESSVEHLSTAHQYRTAVARGLINEPAVLMVENLDGSLAGVELEEHVDLLRNASAAFGTAIIATVSAGFPCKSGDRVLDFLSGAIVHDSAKLGGEIA